MTTMENYAEISKQEKKMENKTVLVKETITDGGLTKHEIISRMFNGLVKEIEQLKQILFKDLAVTNESKEIAEKISKIAFTLQTCLDLKNGGQIAEDLNWLYRHIRYMSKRIQDNDDMNYVQPAFKIATQLKDAWEAMPAQEKSN